jgi:site-specific recombinase XerC
MEISMATGLRISDVLKLQTERIRAAQNGRLTVRESKTGKNRRIYLRAELRDRALAQAGKIYVFEGRLDRAAPRSRQAVYKDLARVAAMWRLQAHISPHSARKVYAVEQYAKSRDLKRVQQLLQHSNEAVTMLYAMADSMVTRRGGR